MDLDEQKRRLDNTIAYVESVRRYLLVHAEEYKFSHNIFHLQEHLYFLDEIKKNAFQVRESLAGS